MTGISVLFLNRIRFGPLVQKWTMRYEARHNYFKNVAQNIGNNIKLTWTPANRHQLLQCYYQTSQESLLTDIMDIDWSMEVAHYSKVNTVCIYIYHYFSFFIYNAICRDPSCSSRSAIRTTIWYRLLQVHNQLTSLCSLYLCACLCICPHVPV